MGSWTACIHLDTRGHGAAAVHARAVETYRAALREQGFREVSSAEEANRAVAIGQPLVGRWLPVADSELDGTRSGWVVDRTTQKLAARLSRETGADAAMLAVYEGSNFEIGLFTQGTHGPRYAFMPGFEDTEAKEWPVSPAAEWIPWLEPSRTVADVELASSRKALFAESLSLPWAWALGLHPEWTFFSPEAAAGFDPRYFTLLYFRADDADAGSWRTPGYRPQQPPYERFVSMAEAWKDTPPTAETWPAAVGTPWEWFGNCLCTGVCAVPTGLLAWVLYRRAKRAREAGATSAPR